MSETYEVVDGKLRIDLWGILQQLPESSLADLVDTLSCQDAVIASVSQQIISGLNDNGFAGSATYGHTPSTPLDKARREVAESAGELAKDEIARLVRICEAKDKYINELWDKVRDLEAAFEAVKRGL